MNAMQMNSKTLVWANTGKPVEAGDLKEGEQFEVELSTGKTKRSPADGKDDSGSEGNGATGAA
jgi:hypothetical protein